MSDQCTYGFGHDTMIGVHSQLVDKLELTRDIYLGVVFLSGREVVHPTYASNLCLVTSGRRLLGEQSTRATNFCPDTIAPSGRCNWLNVLVMWVVLTYFTFPQGEIFCFPLFGHGFYSLGTPCYF